MNIYLTFYKLLCQHSNQFQTHCASVRHLIQLYYNIFNYTTISCIYLLLTPNSRSVFHAGVSLNIHSFILIQLGHAVSYVRNTDLWLPCMYCCFSRNKFNGLFSETIENLKKNEKQRKQQSQISRKGWHTSHIYCMVYLEGILLKRFKMTSTLLKI